MTTHKSGPDVEPLTQGEWIGLLRDRLDSLGATRSTNGSRAFAALGILVVAVGILLSFYSQTALTPSNLGAIAALWLLLGFLSLAVLMGLGMRLTRRAEDLPFEDMVELGKIESPVLFAISAVLLSGMAMGILLYVKSGAYAIGLADVPIVSLVFLSEFLGILFLLLVMGIRKAGKSESYFRKAMEQYAKSQGKNKGTNRSWWVLEFIFCLAALLAAWSLAETLDHMSLNVPELFQLVGSGYVAYGSLVAIAILLRNGSHLSRELAADRKLLLAALSLTVEPREIRSAYIDLLRLEVEPEAVIMRYFSEEQVVSPAENELHKQDGSGGKSGNR